MELLLLAGGRNRSFYPYSKVNSRSLIKIDDKPLIYYAVHFLGLEIQVSHMTILISKASEEDAVDAAKFFEQKFEVPTSVLVDDPSGKSLGTGGCIKNWFSMTDLDSCLVLKCDRVIKSDPKIIDQDFPVKYLFDPGSRSGLYFITRDLMRFSSDAESFDLESVLDSYEKLNGLISSESFKSDYYIEFDDFDDIIKFKNEIQLI